MPDIEFPTSQGHARGYLAVPTMEQGSATVVLQEWWGLDPHIRSVCDRLAADGFFALAPDLHRNLTSSRPDTQGHQRPGRFTEPLVEELRGAVEFLASTPGVEGAGMGALGFFLGGGLALRAAATCPQIVAAVTYYCVMPHDSPDYAAVRGPVLGYFGTADAFIPLKDAKALEMALRGGGVEVTFEKYTGAGHAFFNETNRVGTYDPQAALLSWERTVGFLHGALMAPSSR